MVKQSCRLVWIICITTLISGFVMTAPAPAADDEKLRMLEEHGLPVLSTPTASTEPPPATAGVRGEVLLIPDSTADVVGMYDPFDGTFLGNLIVGFEDFSTPINAVMGPDGNIYVSDQITDSVYVFSSQGIYLYTYADATDGLNNIRGIDFRDGHLFVTSGDDYVAEFDGPHSRLADFINDGSDPFDILFLDDGRALVADIQGTLDNVRLYNTDGTLATEVFSVSFPEQVQSDSLLPGAQLNASFSADLITDFDIDGTIQSQVFFNGGRGIYRLGNGNLLATAGDGVWELNPLTGDIIEQENTGSARFIELADLPPSCIDDVVDLGSMLCGDELFYAGDTTGATDWCANASGDNHFRFEVLEEGRYTITTCATIPVYYDTYLRLYDDTCCGTQIAFDDDGCTGGSSGLMSTIENVDLMPGFYYVQVEGYSANEGPYELRITCEPIPTCEVGDTCDDAIATGVGTFTENSCGCNNDYWDYTCFTSWNFPGPDHVYVVDIPCDDCEVCVSLTPLDGWDPALAVSFECSDGSLACVEVADSGFSGDAEAICFTTTGGNTGTMYIFVDSYYEETSTLSCGNYDLDITISCLANDTCGGAVDISGGGSFNGNTECSFDDYTGAGCGFSWDTPGPDLAYAFTIDDVCNVDLNVTPIGGWDPAIYVVSDCGDIVGSCIDGSDVGIGGDPETLSMSFNCGGTYFLIVDSFYSSGTLSFGEFDLDVLVSCTPPADTFDVGILCPYEPVELVPLGKAPISAWIDNTSAFYRMNCPRLDVTLCTGQVISGIRHGTMTIAGGGRQYVNWVQNIPAGPKTCDCDLLLTLVGEDCTPCENNEGIPPGWVESDSCTITTVCTSVDK